MITQIDPVPVEERLRAIQSITDTALSRLDDNDLLAELMERTREALQADTAAALLLDIQGGQLIATAAAGLEEEVHQGVRIPVGRGFAGRIAAEHQPVILDHVDHTTVLNPILLAKGIQSMLGVPMVAGGRVIGVLHVGSLRPRRFTGPDVEFLQLAADRAAAAVQSMTARADRLAAAALQRSLVPAALPAVAGAEMAARFIPGSGGVGGDWYDVFSLPSGELCVVIGDVAGSGLPAAVIMGRMRSALRAYALETRDPAEVLDRLDRKIQHFEAEAMATVLYAVIEPGLDQMHVCLAGHFPPVIARPGQPAELSSAATGLMIGLAREPRRPVTTVPITPGTLLCFFTDGLVERRGEVIDDGLARLCRSVTAQPPDAACAAVMQDLIGSGSAQDDIALLMLRRQPEAGPGRPHLLLRTHAEPGGGERGLGHRVGQGGPASGLVSRGHQQHRRGVHRVDLPARREHAGPRRDPGQGGLHQVPRTEHPCYPACPPTGNTPRRQADGRTGPQEQRHPVAGPDHQQGPFPLFTCVHHGSSLPGRPRLPGRHEAKHRAAAGPPRRSDGRSPGR
jgi:sigma-B regulation protein RsbU (phosphoserine phosphatase)